MSLSISPMYHAMSCEPRSRRSSSAQRCVRTRRERRSCPPYRRDSRLEPPTLPLYSPHHHHHPPPRRLPPRLPPTPPNPLRLSLRRAPSRSSAIAGGTSGRAVSKHGGFLGGGKRGGRQLLGRVAELSVSRNDGFSKPTCSVISPRPHVPSLTFPILSQQVALKPFE